MLENSRMAEKTVKDHTLMKKGNGEETNMKENGKRGKWMGMEHTLGLLAASTLENSSMETFGKEQNTTKTKTSLESG